MSQPKYEAYKPPVEEEPPILDVMNCTVRLDTNVRDFEIKGGARMFEKNLSKGLGIKKDNVQV